ncbi:VLDLR-like protein [Mya arenaria]|uniref:VLDLR-like protein n=1 Tax=Mya arenaria TaxID=6604 RepID=A0ABY7DSZ6_MYAAR|nr:VLDLR-like protein [Mya arenaria]
MVYKYTGSSGDRKPSGGTQPGEARDDKQPPNRINIRLAFRQILRTCKSEHNYLCGFDPRHEMQDARYPRCVPLDRRCDGTPDCPLADDELGCEPACGKNQVRCPEGGCATACDGLAECADIQDEIHCAPLCHDGEVRCPDGKCAVICDGVVECSGREDEANCTRKYGTCPSEEEVICADHSRCAHVCNGIPECPGAADEINCLPKCPSDFHVICHNGACARPCDGNHECENVTSQGSPDEIFCKLTP